MNHRSTLGIAGTVALVLAAVGLVLFGLRSGTTEVVVDHGPVVTVPEEGTPVVASLRESGGFSLFGWQLTDPTRLAEVQFLAEPGCSARLASGDPWPTPHPDCTGPSGLVGRVAGLGITESGRSLVGVEFEVSGRCFEQLEPSMAWPTGIAACAAGG